MKGSSVNGAAPVRVLACCGGMVTFGGAERMTFSALGAAIDGGATVHCILNGWAYERIAREAERIGATWSTSAYRMRLDRRTRNPVAIARQLADMSRTTRDVLRQMLRTRATHILVPAHDVVIRTWPALAIARLIGVRTVMRLCNAPDDSPFYRRLWRWVVNPVIGRFICNSAFTRRELLACGVPARKTHLIYNTLPVRAPAETGGATGGALIFVGQIIPEKGLHVLMEAVALLAASGVETTLEVVGEIDGWISPVYGDYREVLKARAARPDLAGRVRFLGWREDVPALLHRAALHCCPSLPEIREAFGLVVLEAKAAGVPSVVFPSGALPELVSHGVDGWVCARPTAEDLAEACRTLLRDPDRLAAMRAAARASAQQFSRERFASEWRKVMGIDTMPAVDADVFATE